jgi:hypothetical protein
MAMKDEHDILMYRSQLHYAMTENYRAFIKLINNQQKLHANTLSLVAYQLSQCVKWKKAYEVY